MSTTAPAPTNGHHRKAGGVRTYRGRKLEDLVPKIRAELGPDAIILREREGLMGGINGFFAQRFVEVEARAAAPRVDVYDDDDLLEELTPAAPEPSEPLAAPAATAPPAPSPAESFAQQLEQAAAAVFDDFVADEPEPVFPEMPVEIASEATSEATLDASILDDAPAAAKPRPARKPRATTKARTTSKARTRRTASARLARALAGPAASGKSATAPSQRRAADSGIVALVARELVQCGVSDAWAFQLIGEAGAHCAPFAHHGGLRAALRTALASSIAHARPLPATGAAVAFVGAGGAGKTRCAATLASAYRRASTLSVSTISLATPDNGRELGELLRGENVPVSSAKDGSSLAKRVEKARSGGLVVIDTPAVAPGDQVAVHRLAAELEPLSLDAILVVLPATLGAQTGKRLLTGLSPLQPTGLAISHADETDQLGIAVELAWASRIPVSYIHEGLDIRTALSATDPFGLAARLLP